MKNYRLHERLVSSRPAVGAVLPVPSADLMEVIGLIGFARKDV